MQRQDSLDIFRLISSFAVVILHVSMGNLPIDIQIYLKLLSRFAVPFFFLVSGYFFYYGYIRGGNEFFLKIITKLLRIFLVASIFFLPIDIVKSNFKFSHDLILNGSESHLWFIPSLIFGSIYYWYMMNTLKLFKYLPLISVLTMTPLLLYYYSIGTSIQAYIELEFARFLLSISFMSLGLWLANYKISVSLKRGWLLITLGITLMILEVMYFRIKDPIDLWGFQFLINTIPLALGIFFISFHTFKNTCLAGLGRKYSLGIYLYHPFINMIIYHFILKIFGESSDGILMINPLICFTATLGLLVLLDKRFQTLFNILNGEFKKA